MRHAPASPLWTASTGVASSPVVAGGVVYIGSDDGKLYAFSASGCGASTCSPLWTATTGRVLSPAVANGVVYVAASKLFAFRASSSCSTPCSPLWTGSAANIGVFGELAVANGVVYVTGRPSSFSSRGALVAFAASGCGGSSCSPLWQTSTGNAAISSPVVANGVLYAMGGHSFYGGQYGGAVGFAPLSALAGGFVTAAEMYGGGGFCLACLMKSLAHSSFGSPVDAADGNMYHTFSDIQIPGRGYPLAFTRTYNSHAACTGPPKCISGPLGYGWVDNLGASLVVSGSTSMSGSTATVTEENGAKTTFTSNGSTWAPPPRDIATLAQNSDGSWTLVRDSRQTLTFNGFGQLMSVKDLNGYATSYGYTGGQLTSVTDQAGRTLQLGYSGGHIMTRHRSECDAASGGHVRVQRWGGQPHRCDRR